MQEPKYDLSDFSEESTAAFMADFNELLTKHSAYFEPVPIFVQDPDSKWKVACSIKLLKKTLIGETKDNAGAAVPSPFKSDDTAEKAS